MVEDEEIEEPVYRSVVAYRREGDKLVEVAFGTNVPASLVLSPQSWRGLSEPKKG